MWITNCKSTLCVFARSVCTNVEGTHTQGREYYSQVWVRATIG